MRLPTRVLLKQKQKYVLDLEMYWMKNSIGWKNVFFEKNGFYWMKKCIGWKSILDEKNVKDENM